MILDYLADELRWVTKTTYFLALNSTFPKILFSYKTDWIRTSEIYLVHHQLGFTIEINAEPWFIKRWSHCPTTVLFWSCKHETFICKHGIEDFNPGIQVFGSLFVGIRPPCRVASNELRRRLWLRANEFRLSLGREPVFPRGGQTCFLYQWARGGPGHGQKPPKTFSLLK